MSKILVQIKGGPGSGNWGHSGRPGMRGGSGGSMSAITHARSVRAIRDLGGQVPQKFVSAADRTLQRAGLQPKALHRKKVTKDDLKTYYSNNIPVTGDKWMLPKGAYIEIGTIKPGRIFTPAGEWVESGMDVEFHYVGKRGYSFNLRIR